MSQGTCDVISISLTMAPSYKNNFAIFSLSPGKFEEIDENSKYYVFFFLLIRL